MCARKGVFGKGVTFVLGKGVLGKGVTCVQVPNHEEPGLLNFGVSATCRLVNLCTSILSSLSKPVEF